MWKNPELKIPEFEQFDNSLFGKIRLTCALGVHEKI
jgi:hypothetical protein